MDTQLFIVQLDKVIESFNIINQQSVVSDLSDISIDILHSIMARSISAIHRISGLKSSYSKEIERINKEYNNTGFQTKAIIGVVRALKEDLGLGYLKNIAEIIHSEVFSDFLEMAKHLNDNGYKDAAAVLAGITLEIQLKKIAIKNSIAIEIAGNPIKMMRLNDDLYITEIYNSLDHQNIKGWLKFRNDAAHGDYDKYTKEMVSLFISSVQDFITRMPA